MPIDDDGLAGLGLALGADVPMCLAGQPARATGIGETLAGAPDLPVFGCVLVNPGVAVSTPEVFRALQTRDNPPMPDLPEAWRDLGHLVDWLGATRNDLEAAATATAPSIAEVTAALRAAPQCLFARMSGSGATCFGLFADRDAARRAAWAIQAAHPDWWVAA